MAIDLFRRYRIPIFWVTLIFVYGVAIMPASDTQQFGPGDKIEHIAAFLTLTVLGRLAYLKGALWRLVLGLSAFGALIEATQAIPILQRDASLWDWFADSAAIFAALAIMRPFEQRVRMRLG